MLPIINTKLENYRKVKARTDFSFKRFQLSIFNSQEQTIANGTLFRGKPIFLPVFSLYLSFSIFVVAQFQAP